MLWSTFTLAFFGFLHSSEFTSPSSTHFNPQVHLARSDISFTSDGSLLLQLEASKTDPFRMGCSIMLSPSGCAVCAVRAMHRYLAHRLPGNSIPLYFFSTGQFLTRDKVTLILCFQLQCLGYRVLCISQFPHWGCNYCCRGWFAPLAHPNPWPLVQQLLHAIHQDNCFHTPRNSSPASCHPQFPTTSLGSKYRTMQTLLKLY